MTTQTWIGGSNADWFSATDWSGDVIPSPSDTALIVLSGGQTNINLGVTPFVNNGIVDITGQGTLLLDGETVTNQGTVTISSGSTLEFGAGSSILDFNNAGLIEADAGTSLILGSSFDPTVSNTGSIVANGASISIAPSPTNLAAFANSITGADNNLSIPLVNGPVGEAASLNGSTLEIGTVFNYLGFRLPVNEGTVRFIGDGTLAFQSFFSGPIGQGLTLDGFALGDTIDLPGANNVTVTYIQSSPNTGTLDLIGGGGTVSSIVMTGSYATSDFPMKPDGMGGTEIAFALPSTHTWLSASGGNWFTGSNWSDGTSPQQFDTEVVAQPGSYVVEAKVGSFDNGGTIEVRNGATLSLAGTVRGPFLVSWNLALDNTGLIDVEAGSTLSLAPPSGQSFDLAAFGYTNVGTVVMDNSALRMLPIGVDVTSEANVGFSHFVNSISGTGDSLTVIAQQNNGLSGGYAANLLGETIYVGPTFSRVEFDSSAVDGVVDFRGSGTLALGVFDTLGNTGSFTATVEDFGDGDAIDLTKVDAPSFFVSYTPGTLALGDALGTFATINMVGNYQTSDFYIKPDGNGGTDILLCMATGTKLSTVEGWCKVEKLEPGNRMMTASGESRPVRWIGRRVVNLAKHPYPEKVCPVRVLKGTFGFNCPQTDVLLSPDHAVFTDGVLIPIRYLINGDSIRQEFDRSTITYYHVELDRHDVLIADGLQVESYLDTGGRNNFEDAEATIAMHPDFSFREWEASGCAPLMVTGPIVESVRHRLSERTIPCPSSIQRHSRARRGKRLLISA
jgi:hypothetical protein